MIRFPVKVYSELLGCSHSISPAYAFKIARRLIDVNSSTLKEKKIQKQKKPQRQDEADKPSVEEFHRQNTKH